MMEEEEFEIIDIDRYYELLIDEFSVFESRTDGVIDFEDWRFEIDVQYRETYGEFPVLDDEMMSRLPVIVGSVCHDLLHEIQHIEKKIEEEEIISTLSEKMLNSIEIYLEIRADIFNLDFPHSQRFQRHEAWELDDGYAWDDDDDEYVDEVLDSLVDNGFLRLLEHGGKAKYDTFQSVEV